MRFKWYNLNKEPHSRELKVKQQRAKRCEVRLNSLANTTFSVKTISSLLVALIVKNLNFLRMITSLNIQVIMEMNSIYEYYTDPKNAYTSEISILLLSFLFIYDSLYNLSNEQYNQAKQLAISNLRLCTIFQNQANSKNLFSSNDKKYF